MRKNSNVAIIVHACDRYEFLFRGFEHFFKKYWDHEINCNYYFATETIDFNSSYFTNIKSGTGPWSSRLATLLKESVTEDYVLYLQEDMWLDKKVGKIFFDQLFERAISNGWKQVKLHSVDVYKTVKTEEYIEGFNVSRIDNMKSDYLMSHQATLWNKDFLIDQLIENEDPWRNERRGTKRLKKINPTIFHIDYFSQNESGPINQNESFVDRSLYFTVSENGMLDPGIVRFIEEIMREDVEQQDYAKALLHHFENRLTHDGKVKPRQDDVFKRFKLWLLNRS